MDHLIIIDEFIDEALQQSLLDQLEHQGLLAFEDFQLPGLVNQGTGRRAEVQVPGPVVEAARSAIGITPVESSGRGDVLLPAMMSRGDVRSHRDVWGGLRSHYVQTYTVIIWLQGPGSQLVLEGTGSQHVVDAQPRRLVAFNNRHFQHAVKGPPHAVRAMVGPMAWKAGSGSFQPVMDAQDIVPKGPLGYCLCGCFLCCVLPCMIACANLWAFPLLTVRFIFGSARAALVAPLIALYLALAFAGIALVWSPVIFLRACRGLCGGKCCSSFVTLRLWPLRVPLVLVLSFLYFFLFAFWWIVSGTLAHEEISLMNLLVGGVIDLGESSGLIGLLHLIVSDCWSYHTNWQPDLHLCPRDPPLDAVHPQSFGQADMELGVGGSRSLDSAFFEQSQTWRYVTGDISTREVWEVCLKRTAALGTQLHDEGLISKEDLQSLEPFLFIGLPAAAVVRLVVRSINKDGLDFEELKVTSDNRPHNAFADSIWQTAMRAKQAAEDAQPISDVEMKYLTITALQRPESKLEAWQEIDSKRQAQLSLIVSAAIDLAISASRSRNFKQSIGTMLETIMTSAFMRDVEIHVLGAFAEAEDQCLFLDLVMHVTSRDQCYITQSGSNLRTVPASFSRAWYGRLGEGEWSDCSSASAFGTDVVVRCAFSVDEPTIGGEELVVKLETGDWKAPDIPLCKLQSEGHQFRLTVCSGVMFNAGQQMAGSSLLQQWLAYHQAMGVDHFALYDSDGSAAEIQQVFSVSADAQVSYFPLWPSHLSEKLGTISRTEHCRHCLSVVAEAHCLWSQRGRSDWVITLHSFDAYLAPAPGHRLDVVLNHLESKRHEIGTVPLAMLDFGGAVNSNSSWLVERYQHRAFEPVRVLAEIGRGNPRDECWLNHPGVTMKNPLNVWGVYDHYARSIFGAIDVEVPWQLLRVNHYVDIFAERCASRFLPCVVRDTGLSWILPELEAKH
ncbi:Uncharacterized protein SCF082_LOCUS5116 [Durusdinium trenchii]|uniref:Glycosyltransferase family 92 protein n=1 Tax=Durusdinium trenchii TaxID=1381693 RepID=A0ABP0I5G9_9DINO